MKTKLFRNLKPGDKFVVYRDILGVEKLKVSQTHAIVTVISVQETTRAHFSGKRQWQVNGNYPWWWVTPICAYANEKTELVN